MSAAANSKTCTNCKALKVRCDRRRPCARCMMRGQPCTDPMPTQGQSSSRGSNKQQQMGVKIGSDARPTSSSSSSRPSAHSSSYSFSAMEAAIGPPPEMLDDNIDIYANIVDICERSIQKLCQQGMIDHHKSLFILRCWRILIGKMGIDHTRGLMEKVQGALGISDEDLALDERIDEEAATREQSYAYQQQQQQQQQQQCPTNEGGKGTSRVSHQSSNLPRQIRDFIHPYLSSLDDWKAAVIAWVSDVDQNQMRFVMNERFSQKFASIHEITQKVFGQEVLPFFVLASFVSSADRAYFIEELITHNFHSSDTVTEKDLVVRCNDKRGRNFLALLRIRSESIVKRGYWSVCISIQPLPQNRWLDVADAGGVARDWTAMKDGGEWDYALLCRENIEGWRKVVLNSGKCLSQGIGLRGYSENAAAFFGKQESSWCLRSNKIADIAAAAAAAAQACGEKGGKDGRQERNTEEACEKTRSRKRSISLVEGTQEDGRLTRLAAEIDCSEPVLAAASSIAAAASLSVGNSFDGSMQGGATIHQDSFSSTTTTTTEQECSIAEPPLPRLLKGVSSESPLPSELVSLLENGVDWENFA